MDQGISLAIQGKESRPPLLFGVVANEKEAFGSLSTMVASLVYIYIYIYIYSVCVCVCVWYNAGIDEILTITKHRWLCLRYPNKDILAQLSMLNTLNL